jgi:signal transduction histidine kinase
MTHLRPAPVAAPTESAFAELKRFVGFGPADEFELARLRPAAEAGLPVLLQRLSGPIGEHEEVRTVFSDPQVRTRQLGASVTAWVRNVLQGPWDDSYPERRELIREAWIEQHLPQRFMVGIYDVARRWFTELCVQEHGADGDLLVPALDAVARTLDLDLSLMLASSRDDLLARIARHERLAMLGELSAGIHHELKNPLAAISATAFALQERRALQADPRARELLTRVMHNVRRANEIVGRMLSLTRVRDPALHRTSVEKLVERALDHCCVPPGRRLTVDLDPTLPEIRVDTAHIEQVLLNLLENAFHACRDGGDVRVIGRTVNGDVQLGVSDDGAGIPASDIRRVFEPLFSTKPEGTGLGLALGRRLVQANGGSISLASEVGKGTTVTLSFPR